MRKIIFILFVLILISGCSAPKEHKTQKQISQEQKTQIIPQNNENSSTAAQDLITIVFESNTFALGEEEQIPLEQGVQGATEPILFPDNQKVGYSLLTGESMIYDRSSHETQRVL